MSEVNQPSKKAGFWLLLAGMLSAVGASACCVTPLILSGLGIGGSWLGSLSLLEPYRPVFIIVTLLILTVAFRRVYLTPRACGPDSSPSQPAGVKLQKIAFWIVSALALCLIALPWFTPLF